MSLRRAVLCCGMLAACEGGGTSERPAPIPAVTLLTPAQWSGGVVQVESDAFPALATLPAFTIGADTLAAARLPADRVALTLPVLASGSAVLVVHGEGDSLVVGTVQVYGMGSAHQYAVNFAHDAVPVPGPRPRFLAMGDSAYTAAILDPATGTLTQVSGVAPLQLGGYAPGPLPGRYVARGPGSFVPEVWNLFPGVTHLDTVPFWDPASTGIVPLTDSTWVEWSDQWMSAANTTAGSHVSWPFPNTGRLVVSPRGDLVLLTAVTTHGDPLPVLRTATAGPAFFLAGFLAVRAAAFSPSGDTLLVALEYAGQEDSLLAFRTADGTRLSGTALPAGLDPIHLSLDPRNARLAVLASGAGQSREVLVYNRFSLAREATLACPGGCTGDIQVAEVDTVANRVWLVGYGGVWHPSGAGVAVIGFDLLP